MVRGVEGDEPISVHRVVELFPHLADPVQGFDPVAVEPDARLLALYARVACQHPLGLLEKELVV